ncbi:COG2958 family protein [Desulforamulus ruminis]|uniref:COG2958 family protein n=1 Tax=Desulforamulus ruminis TaxID=1564 RepID=UPI002357B461|nr:HTH domain-containing protein [Desulforamulus ruminis]
MSRLTFITLAEKVLKEANKPLTAEEIWEYTTSKGYEKEIQTQGKTPWHTIGARIYLDMRDNPLSPFIKVGSRPRRFFLKSLVPLENSLLKELVKRENVQKKKSYKERDLHPFLVYFVNTYMNIFVKTIHHEKSFKKSNYNEWLHPDLVGCYFPIDEWEKEVLDFGLTIGSNNVKLFSFEMKSELNFSNLRASFFQTVSNSSWSHEAYLVSVDVSKDEEFLYELKRLSSSFGIGILKLDIEDPDSSEILYPARPKTELDWETVNKLARENPDFKDFLKRISIDISSKEIRKERYDPVIQNIEELVALIKK